MTEQTTEETLTKRQQIQALKGEMVKEQRQAAIELNALCDDVSAKIEALRERTIPGEVVEQAIDNVLNMTKQVASWTTHIIKAGDVVEILPEEAPEV